jgi:ribose transport system permease protein
MLGALTLELLFALMNFSGVSGTVRPAVQGAIILLAVAVSAARSPSD